jgi:hypothetical protein
MVSYVLALFVCASPTDLSCVATYRYDLDGLEACRRLADELTAIQKALMAPSLPKDAEIYVIADCRARSGD